MVTSGRYAVLFHLALALATMLAYAIFRPPRPERVKDLRGPIGALGAWAYWATRWVLRAALALRLTPDALTAIGVALSIGAGVLAVLGAHGWACVALIWGSAADLLDGEVARRTGTSSRAGAFLDSNLDRVSEVGFLAGIAVALHPSAAGMVCAVAAMATSFMVSYARARGEGLGVSCPSFGLERPHRLLAFMIAMCAATFVSPANAARVLTWVSGAVALGAGLTALARVFTIHQLLRRGEPTRDLQGTPPGAMP
ncbi:MAG TPA: CDP-alcohol phosphatidyltransferase family protein [Anaeromyxobacter sp.]|nr:CDP-alcohol phosphatidyltransferase family protein [Anaeromyxobacter sp.]